MVTHPRSAFYRNTQQHIAGVFDNRSLRTGCIFIRHQQYPDNLMMAFFESMDQDTHTLHQLIQYANDLAASWRCTKLIAGLDGHIAYSIGYLEGGSHDFPAFGQSYNPAWYGALFAHFGFTQTRLVSYKGAISTTPVDKLGTYRMKGNIRLDHADFSGKKALKELVARYVNLNTACFFDHKYFFPRSFEEELELFHTMRPLLRPENFIFAYIDHKLCGFLFWYHDFNELVPPQGAADWKTYVKFKLLGRYPITVKIEEIAIIPEYQNTPLIAVLFAEMSKIVARKYPKTTHVTSSWILEENTRSMRFSKRGFQEPFKRFSVYERSLQNEVRTN